jgi:hypothetical protein
MDLDEDRQTVMRSYLLTPFPGALAQRRAAWAWRLIRRPIAVAPRVLFDIHQGARGVLLQARSRSNLLFSTRGKTPDHAQAYRRDIPARVTFWAECENRKWLA